jgi:hypothetical protein
MVPPLLTIGFGFALEKYRRCHGDVRPYTLRIGPTLTASKKFMQVWKACPGTQGTIGD